MVSEFIELRSPTGNNRPTGNYRPTRFWGIWGEFGLFGRTQCAPTGFWGNLGYLGARDAPLRVLDAAEGEKPPHQVNLDTFREKICLHREYLK